MALMEGYQNNRSNLELVYRQGTTLYSIWRSDGQPWRGPTEIHCQ